MASATRLIDGVKAAADDSMVDCIPIGDLIGKSLAHGPDFEAADEGPQSRSATVCHVSVLKENFKVGT